MSAVAPTRTVNCTQCGAPLGLRGGHRVRSFVCGFCGAVLDTRDEYKVVKQFTAIERPPMPLQLGMQGRIKGIEFTIIGVVQYADSEIYRWLEYQVFSPTHGYHWLVFSEGHFVFSRRAREVPSIRPEQKSAFNARGMTFKVYESYVATVIFVEGELTYVAQIGDTVSVIEGICPPYSFTRERSGEEEEYQFGEYLDREQVYKAFGIDKIPRAPRGVHAIQPYIPKPWTQIFSRVAGRFAIGVAVIALLVLVFGGGSREFASTIHPRELVKGAYSPEFVVNGYDSMMRLDLASALNNAWAWYDMTVFRDDQEVASISKGISYYHGYEGGESWSEGSQSAHVYFTLSEPGSYRILFNGSGGTGERGTRMPDTDLNVELNEDVIVSRYFIMLAGVFGAFALCAPLLRARFEARRWEHVLEDEDDD